MRKRYLFFDIDRTLTAGGYRKSYVPESAKYALNKLREDGHFLSLATGRSHAMAQDYMRELGFDNMVSDGGYGVTIGGELKGITPLPKDKMVRLIRECQEKGFAWGIQTDNSVFRTVPDDRFQKLTNDAFMKSRIIPGLDPEDLQDLYKAYIVCTQEEEQGIEALKDLPHYRFFDEYLFVEPMAKAVGIRKVMDYFGADYSDAIVFGDSVNDLSMFVDDWTKVAMGNAIEELKAKADIVTTDVEDDGIYNACVTLGLLEKRR
jgi:Cof subfamily protein (haloacid dehalogenase superfamily)